MPLPCILFVDDDERVLRSLQSIFRRKYKVLTATSGREALAMLQQELVNVIVSDQRMPELLGDELLKQVALDYPSIVRILLTGYADSTLTVDAVNRGEIYGFIAKPWDYDDVQSVIADAVALSKQPYSHQFDKSIEAAELTSTNNHKKTIEVEALGHVDEVGLAGVSETVEKVYDVSTDPLPALLIEHSQSIRNVMRLKCRRLKCTLYSVSSQRHISSMLSIRPDISVLIVGLENVAEAIDIINNVKDVNPQIVTLGLTSDPSRAKKLLQQGLIFSVVDPNENDEHYMNLILAASKQHQHLLLGNNKSSQKRDRGTAAKPSGFSKIKSILNKS